MPPETTSTQEGHAGPDVDMESGIDPAGDAAGPFLTDIRAGQNWFLALLRAVAAWPTPQEEWNSRVYCYVIGGEAFDWLLLAERLLAAADGLIPDEEKAQLLFDGQPPMPLQNGLFRELIGPAKHGAHLNFLYGIVVEEALQQANIEEVAKAQQAMGAREESIENEAFRRLYDAPGIELRKEYRRGLRQSGASGRSSLDDQKGFTYWLFKRRMTRSDPARLASDTRKGILLLERVKPALWQWSQSEQA